MDEHSLGPARQLQQRPIEESINISDVIEVIETDPDFKQATCLSSSSSSSPPQTTSSSVTRSNGSAGTGTMFNNSPIDPAQIRRQATVRIIEQPASKALRFRYECEGRSAGSIPGVNSTAENKTFPTIQIDGYKGKAVVVVSCVTKDHPHRPHPHNLVGRDGCKRGVCTMEISPDSMSISFSNLGIQCVKKKDIEAHLRVREEIRVDPFKTGYTHRSQPTSIDLNSVRLCFQVFTEGDKPGKFTVPLQPVVSDPIYDKKSMTDLTIVKLSDCVSSVDGGRKDIIVLCEKVSKEDIQIRFYEEKDGLVVWEGLGDFQPSQVHKQTAIWFKTPRYRTLDITEPVKVNIQLRRPSDGAISEPLPFELLPLDSGRPSFWSARRKKANYALFNSLLVPAAATTAAAPTIPAQPIVVTAEPEPIVNEVKERMEVEMPAYGEIKKHKPAMVIESNNNEVPLAPQQEIVQEVDEIYTENKKLVEAFDLNNVQAMDTEVVAESFDDSKTYSSLQMAFKNPMQMVEIDIEGDGTDRYEDIVVNPASPVIDLGVKRDVVEVDKLPPLPPKRAKKVIETDICDPVDPKYVTAPMTRSHSCNSLKPVLAPSKRLPPTPCSTLPNPKKRGFFSKLFGKKERSNASTRCSSIEPMAKGRSPFSSVNSLQVTPLNRTPSNRSANSVRIPLKDSLPDLTVVGQQEPPHDQQLNDLSKTTSINNNLNFAPNDLPDNEDEINMNLELTEAENYALYMAMAPHATQSEFDEMSAYYAPVEGGKILTDAEVLMRLAQNKT
ncbi:PREDICTED: embryonic polarity protein dorsal-like isoform X1 [Nicrophorus vespilloides]|uniref:Embryonic polarity protein dorsal-like isoform X1 n=1 Tax=Nicrophorus vespilloides TaxID=110193 RepID=A0ABM1N2V1_NICVS|nr:PREDICTED: embryonic polarity protein dorsal-like isoform X1 [Nicrophorus vespilloides]